MSVSHPLQFRSILPRLGQYAGVLAPSDLDARAVEDIRDSQGSGYLVDPDRSDKLRQGAPESFDRRDLDGRVATKRFEFPWRTEKRDPGIVMQDRESL